MKKTNFPANYSIPKAILGVLMGLGEGWVSLDPYQSFKKTKRHRMAGSPEIARWRYNQAVRYLEMRGQVRCSKKHGKQFLKLTRKGKLQALLDKIKENKGGSDVWDEKWRVIIWDIPESSRKTRNHIRYFLKNLGFYRLQFSVYIRPYAIPRPAVNYLKESKLIKYIRFLRVDQVDDQHMLLKHFNLQKQQK